MIGVLCFSNRVIAFDDKTTHPEITDKTIISSSLDQYLKNNLGLKIGISTSFPPEDKQKTVSYFLKKGSTEEDTPNCRASNHFHNPLLPWNSSFMSDDVTFLANKIREFCNVTGWPSLLRKSDVTWATGYLAPVPGGKKATFLTLATVYNWDRGRENYYKALTSQKAFDRESNFAQTFETIGHILHLLQDVSVPAQIEES